MIAEAALQLDRDAALREVMSYTAGQYGLPHRTEQDIRKAAMRRIEPILQLADSAVAAAVELEAIDRRLDTHVQGIHPRCSADRECRVWRFLQIRRRRLQAAYDRAYVSLVTGRR